MACRLTLLGPPQLLDEHGRLIPLPAKAFALAAYILLTSGGAPTSRSALRQFLWENSDTKTAAANLRKFLLRIRQAQKQFGFELIHEERDHVRLAKSAEIDLARFQTLVMAPGFENLAELCDLYRGELLEALPWEEADSGEWLRVQRMKLRDAFVGAVTDRLEPIEADTDKVSLRVAARRLIEVEPYNEVAHRTLMRVFAEDSEPARVREIYRSLELRLRQDLGVLPDPQTTQLFNALLPSVSANRRDSLMGALAYAPTISSSAQEVAKPGVGETISALASTKSGTPRITILPPGPLGGFDYLYQLAASLIEDVTIGLCRFKSLSVVAPHTAWELSQDGQTALLTSFHIDYAVETQLQAHGGEPKLAVKLVNAVSRDILWIDQFEFTPSSMARRYREMSVQIVHSLVDTIERAELAHYDTEQDANAYRSFLMGQRHLRILDLPSVRRARRAFRSALGNCADFVPAISGLADTFQMEWLLMARGENGLLSEAERLAGRSLELDPEDARGYRSLGLCSLYAGRFDESLEAFSNAERRNPQHADLLVDFADALQHSCDAPAALEKVQRAIELNPLGPDRYWWVAGDVNFHLERYDEAIDCMSRMRDSSPAFRLIAASWAMLGDRQKAGDYVRKAKEIYPDFTVNSWISILPIRNPEFAQRYEQGLREAGFE